MKYRILVRYATGNSFGSEDTQDYIELEWENLDIAKENLVRIKEHYEYYTKKNSFSFRNDEKSLEKYKTKEWYSPQYEWVINLKLDDGKNHKYSAFWIGYFETLYSAELIPDESDMKITID